MNSSTLSSPTLSSPTPTKAIKTECIHEAIERLATQNRLFVNINVRPAQKDQPSTLPIDTSISIATLEQAETAEASRNTLANYFGNVARQFATLEASIRSLDPSFLTLSPTEYVIFDADDQELYRTPDEGQAFAFTLGRGAGKYRIDPPLPNQREIGEIRESDSWFAVNSETNAAQFSSPFKEAAEEYIELAGPELFHLVSNAEYHQTERFSQGEELESKDD